MRTTFKIAGVAVTLALAGLALPACSEKPPTATSEQLIEPPPDDPAVLAAMKQAIDTQEIFWTKFEAREPGVTNYGVKLGMTGPDRYKEFIWAEPIRREGGEVVARLANEPVHLTGLQLGSEVHVNQELVFDWTYEKGGKAYGHFTTRALAKHATPAQRAEIEGLLAPTPLEPDPS